MMRRTGSSRRRRLQVSAGSLIVVLVAALRPEVSRAQAMVRDEPALHSLDVGGPGVSVDGRTDPGYDPTIRQPPSGTVAGSGLPVTSLQGGSNVIDLTGGHGLTILTDRAAWRPIFYLNVGVAYNDNIFIDANKRGDAITTIEPGIILALGDFRDVLPRLGTFEHVYLDPLDDTDAPQRYIYLDYHPSIYVFARTSSQNAVDESLNLYGNYNFPKLGLALHAQYQKLSIEDIDAGDRIDREFYTLDLTAFYEQSTKTSWEFDFGVRDREYQAPYTSSTELVSQNFLNYAYGPKTQFSVGFAVGYLDYRNIVNQTYQQGLLRVTSVQFAKLDFVASGGIEYRENIGGNNNVIGGIFNVTANFHPYDGTIVTLLASRDTEPSAIANEDVTYTRVGVSLNQRFLSRIYLTLSASYGNSDYSTVQTGQSLSRTDNVEEFFASVGTDVTAYATLQCTYQFRNSTSTEAGRTYTENIGGVDVRFTY